MRVSVVLDLPRRVFLSDSELDRHLRDLLLKTARKVGSSYGRAIEDFNGTVVLKEQQVVIDWSLKDSTHVEAIRKHTIRCWEEATA